MREEVFARIYSIIGGELWEIIVKIVCFFVVIFTPIKVAMIFVPIFIILDQITGMTVAIAKKEWDGEKFNRFFIKLILYFVPIVALFAFETMLFKLYPIIDNADFPSFIQIFSNKDYLLTNGLALVVCFVELKSIFVNVNKMYSVFGLYFQKVFKNTKNKEDNGQ